MKNNNDISTVTMRDMKNFNDIQFGPHPIGEGIQGKLIINGITLSVVAGPGLYSSPRANGTSPNDFDSFEIGVWDDNGWLTSELVDTNGDDVMGWQTIDDINKVIKKIEDLTIS